MAPGGIETLVLDLALADPAVTVVSLEGTAERLADDWRPLEQLGDRFVGLDKQPGIMPALTTRLARMLRTERASAVIAHHVGPLVYGGLAARLAGVGRLVHVEHDAWHYAEPRRRRLAQLVHRVLRPRRVAVSRATAAAAVDALGVSDITIIPNGIDLQRFRPVDPSAARARLGLPASVRLVGSVGRLANVKGQDVLISALALMPAHVHAALVGDGPEADALRRRAVDLGLRDRTHFLGHRDRVEAIYPAFDVLCLPSRAEGLPRCIVEAQACGVPVVATAVGGVAEAVCPRTGVLAPPDQPDALARALMSALERGPVGRPRAFVDPFFSFTRTLEAYRALAQDTRP
jgi:glycosyltransferase involved in cell wall biosynthesis